MSRPKFEEAGARVEESSLAALAEAARGDSAANLSSGWTLPSGEDLVKYALKGGFLAPGLLSRAAETVGSEKRAMESKRK